MVIWITIRWPRHLCSKNEAKVILGIAKKNVLGYQNDLGQRSTIISSWFFAQTRRIFLVLDNIGVGEKKIEIILVGHTVYYVSHQQRTGWLCFSFNTESGYADINGRVRRSPMTYGWSLTPCWSPLVFWNIQCTEVPVPYVGCWLGI